MTVQVFTQYFAQYGVIFVFMIVFLGILRNYILPQGSQNQGVSE